MPGRARIRWAAGVVLATAWLTPGRPAAAQERGLDVTVEYIAGSDLYLNVGTDQGVAVGDTLYAYQEVGGAYLGALWVKSGAAGRAVVTFVAEPFPVTRGRPFYVTFTATAAVAEREAQAGTRRRAAEPSGLGPTISGRLAMEVDAFRSRTEWRSNDQESVERTFATPAMGLRLRVGSLPGGLHAATNLRASYRYSSPDAFARGQSVRLYQASLGRAPDRTPLAFEVGRFYNPFETFSGYWDGGLLRVGGRNAGIGVVAGFDPDRGDEEFSTERPKLTAFADLRLEGEDTDYRTDVSFHQTHFRDGIPTHTFVGWSQAVRWRALSGRHDLQLDLDPDTDSWVVTRLTVSASVPLIRGIELHGRYGLRQPYLDGLPANVIAFRRDQVGGGLSFWGPLGFLGLDVAANRFADGEYSLTYSGSFNLRRLLAGVGITGSGSYWSRTDTRALQLAGALERAIGPTHVRAGYQMYRTQFGGREFLTHAVEATVLAPLGRRVRWSVSARTQWGGNLTSNRIHTGLWTSF